MCLVYGAICLLLCTPWSVKAAPELFLVQISSALTTLHNKAITLQDSYTIESLQTLAQSIEEGIKRGAVAAGELESYKGLYQNARKRDYGRFKADSKLPIHLLIQNGDKIIKSLMTPKQLPLSPASNSKGDYPIITVEKLKGVSIQQLTVLHLCVGNIGAWTVVDPDLMTRELGAVVVPLLTLDVDGWSYLGAELDQLLKDFTTAQADVIRSGGDLASLAARVKKAFNDLPPRKEANLLFLLAECAEESQSEELVAQRLHLAEKITTCVGVEACASAEDEALNTPFGTYKFLARMRMMPWEKYDQNVAL